MRGYTDEVGLGDAMDTPGRRINRAIPREKYDGPEWKRHKRGQHPQTTR